MTPQYPFLLLLLIFTAAAQTTTGIISGVVTDPSAAVIPRANVMVTSETGKSERKTVTDDGGRFRIDHLPIGSYAVRIEKSGFEPFARKSLTIAAGTVLRVDVKLEIRRETENVDVSDSAAVDVDPAQSASKLVLRGTDLDALSDDSEDLANDLQMLAGPSAGPNGPQIFIDGFTDGIMPPKQSIREIRVNQNPFSAEFDRVGFGRIEILTKPGSDRFHGQASFEFGNRSLTARNPFLLGSNVPDYQQEITAGNVGGPLTKKSSFFVDVQSRITDENAVLNFTQLDSVFNPQPMSAAVLTPSRRFSFSPRIDYALTPNQTLTVRYSLAQNTAKNQGLSTQSFDLPSRAYATDGLDHNLQISETAVLGTKAVNDMRFQFYRTHSEQRGVSSAPEIDVQGSFSAGGTFPYNYANRNRYEFQNYTTLIAGSHTLRFGLRWRGDWLNQQSTTNFNGRFIFSGSSTGLSALQVYRQNQVLAAQGTPQTQIAALGFGPSQFSLTVGKPAVGIHQVDVSPFFQDDWRLRPNLSISFGLRYEAQNQISNWTNFAPRLALAWAPRHQTGSSKTILRAGSGIFYDRFTSDLLWNAARLNGVAQAQYIIRNPTFYPQIPDVSTVAGLSALRSSSSAPATYGIDPQLRVPYLIQTSAAIERTFPHGFSVALIFSNTRGVRGFRTRDINAPLPTAFDSRGLAIGPRPFGDSVGDVYQYEANGNFRQNQVIISSSAKVMRRVSLFGYYVYGRAMSDTDGAGTFPSNPYDLRSEYGRATYDNRHRAFISGTFALPLAIRLAPFIFMQSGLPYNVVSGFDANNDGNPNDDRPAYAQALTRPSIITKPGFGSFDTAPGTLPNAVLIPRNSLEGPGILSLTVRVSRSWSFGESRRGGGNTGGDDVRGGESIRNGGLSGGSSQSGMSSVFGGSATHRPFNITLTASIRNALNNVNAALPIGNLSSPYFGQSVALSTYGPLPGAGPSAGAGNRHIELQLRFTF